MTKVRGRAHTKRSCAHLLCCSTVNPLQTGGRIVFGTLMLRNAAAAASATATVPCLCLR